MLIPQCLQYYKYLVLKKMTRAFKPGDPVLELAALGKGIPQTVLEEDDQPWIRKAEQLKINEVCTLGSNIFPIRPTVLIVSHFSAAYMIFLLSRLVPQLGPLPSRCNTDS